MTRPTLAICIPAYNESQILPVLMQAIHNQTTPFDEVWLYDDCSTDGTAELAEKLGAKVIRGVKNVGCSVGKNVLAKHTTCDWVLFLDADDLPLPFFVERARRWMEMGQSPDIVAFNYDYCDIETNEVIAECRFDSETLQRDAVGYTIKKTITNVCIYRRERFSGIGGFVTDREVRYNEDGAFHSHAAQSGLTYGVEAETSLMMLRRPRSMSADNRLKCVQAQYEVMRRSAERVGHTHFREIAARLWQIAGCAAADLDWRTANACVALATRLAGRKPPNAGRLFSALARVSPRLALQVREQLIRLLKPSLRRG